MSFCFLMSFLDCSCENASYYGNRAATLMMIGKFREALEDAQQAVRLDDSFLKVVTKYFLVFFVKSVQIQNLIYTGFFRFM